MANTVNDKSTKTEIAKFLKENFKEVVKKDKSLADRIKYTSDQTKKDPKSVLRSDLFELAEEVMQLMGIITKPAEMSSKLGSKSIPMASIFPPDFELEDHKFVAVPFKYQTIDELREKVNAQDESIVFAAYWTKRHIRQFNYVDTFKLKKLTNEDIEFARDMDIIKPQFALESEDTIVASSLYTDAIYLFFGDELKAVEDTDSDGNKYVLRFSNGMEFQIYEVAKKIVEKDEEAEKEPPKKDEEAEPQIPKQEESKEEKKVHKAKIRKPKTEPKKGDSTQMTLNDSETPANDNSENTVAE